MTSLAGQIADFKLSRNPDATVEASAESSADLEARLVAENVPGTVSVGTALPDATVLNAQGDEVQLRSVLGGAPAVIVFYRGSWCPYCNIALRHYHHELESTLTSAGYQLIAISPQKPDDSLTAEEKATLGFTVLSDPGNGLAAALGVLSPTLAKDTHAAGNVDGTSAVPYPTTVIVDAAGVITFIDSRGDYTSRTEASTILAQVRG
ncbi:MAG: peroxiredoxin-like family protein [Rhodoglobus sp.]|nr:peroxiredoxin-like family protein [Rhodoglobus sp.]